MTAQQAWKAAIEAQIHPTPAGVLHQAVDGPAVPPPPTFDQQVALAVQLVDGQLTGSILPIYVRLQFGSGPSQLGSF